MVNALRHATMETRNACRIWQRSAWHVLRRIGLQIYPVNFQQFYGSSKTLLQAQDLWKSRRSVVLEQSSFWLKLLPVKRKPRALHTCRCRNGAVATVSRHIFFTKYQDRARRVSYNSISNAAQEKFRNPRSTVRRHDDQFG